ncbi:1-acyl-sn-glycerol-3-phosphate acyltransferase [Lewinella lacunae]|uniref:1-acyl-sn-glycerol-3-phosphate acyltransferase n=2 Tax=Neolewinella lacunae TaxID=1517758 RepID=A0A923PK25_9BACT|nr:1-acyl-sn-glycerol-3-phosphate acyltransferase [Neolewinella lacunae]
MRIVDHNVGKWPEKYVLPVAPHTSNRDFFYGVYSRMVIREYVNFVGKSSLFRGPLGLVLRWMGGVPVEREKRTNFVDSVVALFRQRDEFRLCIAVEGTRKKVDHFKTGFYFIALKAGVPLLPCKFDFANGIIEFAPPYYPTGDIRVDFDFLYRYFDGVQGLVPENSFTYDPAVLDLLPEVRQ